MKAESVRNQEYNFVKEKLNYSQKAHKADWWKDHNSPDVKPYSVSLRIDEYRFIFELTIKRNLKA